MTMLPGDQADLTYEATKHLARLLASTPTTPAPLAYEILGNIKNSAHHLSEIATLLTRSLPASATALTLTEADPDRDPLESIAEAVRALHEAATHLTSAGHVLDQAQSAIAGQGYIA